MALILNVDFKVAHMEAARCSYRVRANIPGRWVRCEAEAPFVVLSNVGEGTWPHHMCPKHLFLVKSWR